MKILRKWWFWVIIVITVLTINAVHKHQINEQYNNDGFNVENTSEPEVTVKELTVKQVITNEIGAKRIREISVNESEKIVLAHINAEVETKNSLLTDSKLIIQSLQNRSDLNNIEVIIYTKLRDVYGKDIDTKVFDLRINKEKYSQILWKNFNINDFSKIADFYFMHEAITK